MLTAIVLNGHLRDFAGRQRWKFDIETPAEAVRALEMARPGFKVAVAGAGRLAYRVRVGKRTMTNANVRDRMHLPCVGRTITITPVIEGSGSTGKGVGEIILGVVLVAAAVVAAVYGQETLAFQLGLLGVGLILGGVSTLLAPSPSNPATKKNKGSYIFQTPINTLEQGGPVALSYGRPFQGSQVVSADMVATDITTGSRRSTAAGDNTGSSLTSPGQPARSAYDVGSNVLEP